MGHAVPVIVDPPRFETTFRRDGAVSAAAVATKARFADGASSRAADHLASMKEAPASPPPVRRRRLWKFVRWCALLLLLLAAGAYLGRREIGALLAQKLDEKLTATGVYVSWESAQWVPGPGIELSGLAVYRDPAKQQRLALLSQVTVLKAEPGWNRWESVLVRTTDARLVVSNGPEETVAEKLSLRAKVRPGRLELESGQALALGLRIEAKGECVLPTAGEVAKSPAPATAGPLSALKLEWLKSAKRAAAWLPEKEVPLVKVDFRPHPTGKGLQVETSLQWKSFRWRGMTWELLQAEIRTAPGSSEGMPEVELTRVRLAQAGKSAELAGTFDPTGNVLKIARLESDLDLLALARGLVPEAAAKLDSIAAPPEWRLTGAGEVPVLEPEKSRFEGRLALNGSLVLASGSNRVVLQQPAAAFALVSQRLTVSDFRARVWDGELSAPQTQVSLSFGGDKPQFQTELRLRGARLQQALASFGSTAKQPGVVQFDWKGGGGFELASVSGAGSLGISDAEFFEIPLLGTLTVVFNQLTPSFGRAVVSSLRARHRLAGGKLQIENLVLDNQQAHVEAEGGIDLARQYAKLTARANLRGIVGLATVLLTSLLELEGEGPLRDVRWRLKSAPGTRLIGGAAEAVGKTGGTVIEGAGNAVKGTGKAASDLLKKTGKLLPGR